MPLLLIDEWHGTGCSRMFCKILIIKNGQQIYYEKSSIVSDFLGCKLRMWFYHLNLA